MQFALSFWLQKKKLVNKQLMHNIINTKSLYYKSICLFLENLGLKPPSTSILDYLNSQKTSCQAGC